MSKIIHIAVVGLLLALSLPGGGAWAAETATEAEKRLVLNTAAFPPFREQSSKQGPGADYEIVSEVFRRLGYQLQVDFYPLQRSVKLAAAGQAAGFFTFTRNAEREQAFIFSAPISTVRDVLFKQRGRLISWQTLDDLKAYRVSGSEGYNYAPVFMTAMKMGVIKVSLVSGEQPERELLRWLARGISDVAICEVSVCSALLARYPQEFADIDYIDHNVGDVRTFHLAISRQHPGAEALVQEFDRELARFAKEGRRKEIFRRYGMPVTLD